MDLLDRGMREPLPLYRKTSAAYAAAAAGGDLLAAAAAWDGGYDRDGEDQDAAHALVLGGTAPFDDLLEEAPAPDESGRRVGRGRAHPLRPPRPATLERAAGARADREPVSTAIPAFRADGPLPVGVTLLEASAGTGKTHTIASLVARYVAEGVPLEELLVVTFTRAATSELRERVRVRLLEAEAALAEAAAGMAARDDAVLALLSAGAPDELALRRGRIRRALADFDAATIATTHGFCQQMLEGLGTAGDSARDAVFAEDIGDLVGEVADDLYLRGFHAMTAAPFPTKVAHARRPGRRRERPRAARAPRRGARLAAADARGAGRGDPRELERRKRRMRIVTYDDFLTLLHTTLGDPAHGEDVCARVRARYRVALIDEFQDTDPVQWEIVRRAFSRGHARADRRPQAGDLLLPRSGRAHLPARAPTAPRPRDALGQLAQRSGAHRRLRRALPAGAPGARADPLPHRAAAPAVAERRLAGAPDDAPLRVRIVRRDAGLVTLTDRASRRSTRPGPTWRATSRPTSCASLLSGRDHGRRPSGPGPPRAPGDSRAHQSPGLPRARRPRRGRRPRGHQRRGKRLRHPRPPTSGCAC